MAIQPNPNLDPGGDVYGYDPFEGMNSTSASSNVMHGDTNYDTNALRSQFINSAAYKQIVAIFEKSPHSDFWMAKLQNLVSSLQIPSRGFFDDVANGLTGKYAKEFTAALQSAFASLNSLYNEWFQWFTKLPIEQRNQFEAAGLNIALDGGAALKGSEFLGSDSSLQVPDVIEQGNKSFDNAVNFVTSTADGLLSLVGLVNQVFSLRQQNRSLDITENSTLSSINLQRLALGLSPLSSLPDVSSSKVQYADEMSPFGIKSSNEAEAGSKKSRIALETEVNPLYNAVHDATYLGIGPYNEIMSALGNMKLGQIIYQQLYDKEKLAFDTKQLAINSKVQGEFGESLAIGEAQTTLAEQAFKQTDFRVSSKLKDFGEQLYDYKKSVLSDWIEKANSDSPDAFIYSSMLMKSGFDLSTFMGPADVGFEYLNKAGDFVDQVLSIFNPLKWLKPLKKLRK